VTPVYKLSASSIKGRTNYGNMLAGNSVFISTITLDYLVVAGGGGGGNYTYYGGGGAGGYRSNTSQIFDLGTSYTITVGNGAAVNTKGGDSSISGTGMATFTSTGGGFGGNATNIGKVVLYDGGNGGSGGGAGNGNREGGLGNSPSTSPSQGSNGGAGYTGAGNAAGGSAGARLQVD
jgi:hypothetical protein